MTKLMKENYLHNMFIVYVLLWKKKVILGVSENKFTLFAHKDWFKG